MASAKVMLLGNIGVGKTSLVRRLVHGGFAHDYKATVGVDLYTYRVEAPGHGPPAHCDLVIWDTDGDFGESIFSHVYCRGASAALIIIDAARPETWDSLSLLSQGFEASFPGRPHAAVVNKCDLVPEFDVTDLPEPVRRSGESPALTSAKTGENVECVFRELAVHILRRAR